MRRRDHYAQMRRALRIQDSLSGRPGLRVMPRRITRPPVRAAWTASRRKEGHKASQASPAKPRRQGGWRRPARMPPSGRTKPCRPAFRTNSPWSYAVSPHRRHVAGPVASGRFRSFLVASARSPFPPSHRATSWRRRYGIKPDFDLQTWFALLAQDDGPTSKGSSLTDLSSSCKPIRARISEERKEHLKRFTETHSNFQANAQDIASPLSWLFRSSENRDGDADAALCSGRGLQSMRRSPLPRRPTVTRRRRWP